MATYNDLPIELTAGVFSFLRHERRQPPHFMAMNDLISKAAEPFIDWPHLYNEAGESLNEFKNRAAGPLDKSDEWWVINDMMEWYDFDEPLFNNKGMFYQTGGLEKSAFYMTYLLRVGLRIAAP